jgi:hypothetical protein
MKSPGGSRLANIANQPYNKKRRPGEVRDAIYDRRASAFLSAVYMDASLIWLNEVSSLGVEIG